MTKTENARRIIRYDKPEQVVRDIPKHFVGYRGVNHESLDGRFGHGSPIGSRWTDIWGVEWEKKQEGIMGYPISFPLSEPEDLAGYKWPSADDPMIYERIYQMAEDRKDPDTLICGSHRNLLFEKVEKLMSMENLLVYLYTEPEFVREIFERYTEFQLGIAKHYLAVGVDMIHCSEDLGTQNSTLISKEMLNEFLVPYYKRLFDFYKQYGVMIELHSCGHIEPFLDVFMDLGVDVLNPIQYTANDVENIRKITQGRMALHGGIRSDLLLDGTPAQIEAEVERMIKLLGKDGGYFCDIDQAMIYPKQNVEALDRAVAKYGKYPICE